MGKNGKRRVRAGTGNDNWFGSFTLTNTLPSKPRKPGGNDQVVKGFMTYEGCWEHMKAEDGSGLASYISKTTCKEGSILNRVDLEGKKGCQIYTYIYNTHIPEKQVSGQKKNFQISWLFPPKEWLPPNKAMSSLSWGHSQEGAVTICQRWYEDDSGIA